ncbi:flagellar biosynthesis protein FliP [Bradyrhizobium sp. LM4.3]
MKLRVLLLALVLVVLPEVALAQIPDLNSLLPPGNGSTSGRIIQLMAVITVLSVAPGLLIMVTSFTRFAVALSFLRAGLGLQTTPANLVLISLALFMTFYVMAPTFDRAWETGVQPLMKNEISEEEAYLKITDPFREFMLAHVRDKDLQTFEALAAESFRKKFDDKRVDMRVIIPAFMISGAPAFVRDRIPHHPAFPRDRHDRGDADHVDGHDDDAADDPRAAVQDAVLRADRRLEPARLRTGAVVLVRGAIAADRLVMVSKN